MGMDLKTDRRNSDWNSKKIEKLMICIYLAMLPIKNCILFFKDFNHISQLKYLNHSVKF